MSQGFSAPILTTSKYKKYLLHSYTRSIQIVCRWCMPCLEGKLFLAL